MTGSGRQRLTKITFYAKVSKLKEGKYAIIIPKQYNDKVEGLWQKQVKMILNDEL